MSSTAQQRQVFLRQLIETCPESLLNLKTYLTSYTNLLTPSYKKTRDPLAMKELSLKCPSCLHIYTSYSFNYHGKVRINKHLHRILSIRRKYKRIPSPNTYKRRLLDNFTTKSRSKLFIKCFHCNEIRKFQGSTRKDILKPEFFLSKPISKPAINNIKLKQRFDKVSCHFLKKESNLRTFLEQL